MQARVKDKCGESYEWSATPTNGMKTNYGLFGVKSFDDMQDDVLTAFVWAWSVKDVLKVRAIEQGKTPAAYEASLDAVRCLTLCSDIANRAKHGELDRSRSGCFAKLGALEYSIPQAAVAAFSYGADWANTIVAKPELVEMELPILDNQERVVGDAFYVLDCAVRNREVIAKQLGIPMPATKPLSN